MGTGVCREIQEGGDVCVIYLRLIHVVVWGNQHNLVKQLSSSQKNKQLIAAEILAINKGLR